LCGDSWPGTGIFSSLPLRANWHWSPPILISSRYWGPFPQLQSGWGMKLTIHLLVPRLRVHGTIPPLPWYVFMVWYLVKHRDNFTFTLKCCTVVLLCAIQFYLHIWVIVQEPLVTDLKVFRIESAMFKVGNIYCRTVF